jgi:hypothetical protein
MHMHVALRGIAFGSSSVNKWDVRIKVTLLCGFVGPTHPENSLSTLFSTSCQRSRGAFSKIKCNCVWKGRQVNGRAGLDQVQGVCTVMLHKPSKVECDSTPYMHAQDSKHA